MLCCFISYLLRTSQLNSLAKMIFSHKNKVKYYKPESLWTDTEQFNKVAEIFEVLDMLPAFKTASVRLVDFVPIK